MIVGPALIAWALWLLTSPDQTDSRYFGIFVLIVGVSWLVRRFIEWFKDPNKEGFKFEITFKDPR